MANKHTVTLYPPEHGSEPHEPIEVEPGQVQMMRQKGWRNEDDMPVPEKPKTEDPPLDKKSRKKAKNAKVSESSTAVD